MSLPPNMVRREHSSRIGVTLEWTVGTLERITVPSFQMNAYLGVGQDREEARDGAKPHCPQGQLPDFTLHTWNSGPLSCHWSPNILNKHFTMFKSNEQESR